METTIVHYPDINALNESLIGDHRKYFVITDDRVHEFCYIHLPCLQNFPLLVLPHGEKEKSLESCKKIWNFLLEEKADRKSVAILLGGGVLSDVGGFAASTFQRGIETIYIPTTLLSMADAAIGGKTAINFMHYKNYIGSFHAPAVIHLCTTFLKTLSESALLNGWAEMIKHGIIADADHFSSCISLLQQGERIPPLSLLKETASIKSKVVELDPYELGMRKSLNVGHTLAHALEEYYFSENREIAHGHAVAIGIYLESWIAAKMNVMNQDEFEKIKILTTIYSPVNISLTHIENILDHCQKDKKNQNGRILMALPEYIGKVRIDVAVSTEQIKRALETYYTDFIA